MFVAASAAGQAPARLQFDVVSVKPNTGVERGVQIAFPSPGRFHAQNVWLRFLIQNAWNVKDYQVIGGPPWAASDRFDIEAKTDARASREQMERMVQSLLEDRFQLVLHHESRNLPIYRLAAGAKGGIHLRPSVPGSCRGAAAKPACGSTEWSPRGLTGTAIAMPQLVAMLANILQRPVVDDTGFTATFDVSLTWTPDQTTPGLMAPGVASPPLPALNDAGPTIFHALADVGLKLQAAKGPVDVLVIDRAEKATAN